MKKIVCVFIFIICCLFPLFSEIYYLPPLEFSIPNDWTATEKEDTSIYISPDGEFFIHVWRLKEVFERKEALDNINSKIKNIIAGFEIKMAEEQRINDLFVYIADGDGLLGGKNVGVSVAVVEADTYVEVFYYIFVFTGTNEGWNNHWKKVNETIESVTCEREGG